MFVGCVDFCLVTPRAVSLNLHAQYSSVCSHPNVVKTYEVIISSLGPVLLIEKVETSLLNLLVTVGDEVSVRERVNLSLGIVSAVDYFHRQLGIVHGLVHAHNICITSQFTAKLLDPAAALLVYAQVRNSAASFADDIRHLVQVLHMILKDAFPAISLAWGLVERILIVGTNMYGTEGEEKDTQTMQMLTLLEQIRQTSEYGSCSKGLELSWCEQ